MKVITFTTSLMRDFTNRLFPTPMGKTKPCRRSSCRALVAETLELRMLLSATGEGSASLLQGWMDLDTDVLPIPVEIQNSSDLPSTESWFDRSILLAGVKGAEGFGNTDVLLGSSAFSREPSFASPSDSNDSLLASDWGSFGAAFAPEPGGHLELQSVQTGQVLVASASVSVQDGTGLTLAESSGPTVQMRTVDAEGRVVTRLALVKRSSASSGPVMPPNHDAALAEHVHAASLIAEQSQAQTQPDLLSWETALDQETSAPGTRSANSRRMNEEKNRDPLPTIASSFSIASRSSASQKPSEASGRESDRGPTKEPMAGQLASPQSADTTAEDPSSDFREVAIPAFEPRPRDLILSAVCLGWLAHLWTRERKRQARQRRNAGAELA